MTTNHLRPPANHFPGATEMVAPPAEGEVGEQVAELRRRGHSHPSTDQARLFLRAAALRAAALYSYCPVDRRILATIADELENNG